jgi:hypothetical protein
LIFYNYLKKKCSAIPELSGTPLEKARALVKAYGRWLFRATTELQVELMEKRFGIVLTTPRIVLPLANIGLLRTKPKTKDIVCAAQEAKLLKAKALARATTTAEYTAAVQELEEELTLQQSMSVESQEAAADPLDQPGPSHFTTTPRRRRILARKIEF